MNLETMQQINDIINMKGKLEEEIKKLDSPDYMKKHCEVYPSNCDDCQKKYNSKTCPAIMLKNVLSRINNLEKSINRISYDYELCKNFI